MTEATMQPNQQEVKSLTIMVPTNNVIPNPLNPRKNDAIDTETISHIVKKHGWEEPLTAYKRDDNSDIYVLLAGHRRLFAAKEAKIKEVPVFVVKRPESEIEEIQRIGSLQSGRVNWTPYEWASYTYNLWLQWGKPARADFAKEIGLKRRTVSDYILVMEYYPRIEIEGPLTRKEITISHLSELAAWIKALVKYKPTLVEQMGEDLIRKTMIDKIIDKKVDRPTLRYREYCKIAGKDKIIEFLTNRNTILKDQITYLGLPTNKNDLRGHLISMSHFENRVKEIHVNTETEKDKALASLKQLQELIEKQMKKISDTEV